MFQITILVLGCALLLCFLFYFLLNGITPMPTSKKVQRLLSQNLPPIHDGIIYDLGSGWGTSTLILAKAYPQSQIIGLENFPLPYFFSKIRASLKGQKNITFIWTNIFTHHLSNASLIFCYLYPGAMEKLKNKFEKELKPNTLVISNTFGVPHWKSEKTIHVDDIYNTPLYFYQI